MDLQIPKDLVDFLVGRGMCFRRSGAVRESFDGEEIVSPHPRQMRAPSGVCKHGRN